MKRLLSLLTGLVIVLAFGMAYADDTMQWNYDHRKNNDQWNNDKGDKLILDQDLLKYDQDQKQGTIDQMPAKPGAGGSGAGGTGESESTRKGNTYEKPAPAPLDQLEKNFTEPYDNGRSGEDPYKPMEKYDGDTYRY